MSDLDDTNNVDDADDEVFDDVARRAGRGLGAITPNRPAAASVRKRVTRRKTTMLGGVAAVVVVAIVAVSANNNSNGTGPKISIASPSSSATPSTLAIRSDAKLIYVDDMGVSELSRAGTHRLSDLAGAQIAYQLSDSSLVVERTLPESGATPSIYRVLGGEANEIDVLRGKTLLSVGRRAGHDVLVLRDVRSTDGNQWISLYDVATAEATRTGIADVPGAHVGMVSVADELFAVSGSGDDGKSYVVYTDVNGQGRSSIPPPKGASDDPLSGLLLGMLSPDGARLAFWNMDKGIDVVVVDVATGDRSFVWHVPNSEGPTYDPIPSLDFDGRFILQSGALLVDTSGGSEPRGIAAVAGGTLSRVGTVATGPTTTTGVLTTTTTAPPATTTTLQLLQITVDTPTPGLSVPSDGPMLVSGKALTFESVVNIKIYDDHHNLILETKAMAAAPNAEPGPYSILIEFPTKVTAPSGTLEVFEYSAKDGAEVHKVIVPIAFTA